MRYLESGQLIQQLTADRDGRGRLRRHDRPPSRPEVNIAHSLGEVPPGELSGGVGGNGLLVRRQCRRGSQCLTSADALALLGARRVAGEDRGRIAGREPQQQEYQHRDDQEDRDRRGEPPGDEGDQFFLTFQ